MNLIHTVVIADGATFRPVNVAGWQEGQITQLEDSGDHFEDVHCLFLCKPQHIHGSLKIQRKLIFF